MTETESSPIDPLEEGALDPGLSALERDGLVPDLLARRFSGDSRSYWRIVWDDFKGNRIAVLGIWTMAALALLGIFTPLLANQRPFVLVTGEGWEFPLFRSLSATDLVLLIGLFQVIVGVLVYGRARKRKGETRPLSVMVLMLMAVGPILYGLLYGEVSRAADESLFWWGRVVVCGGLGLFLAVPGLWILFTNRRDQLGRLETGPAIASTITGSILICVMAANMARLGHGGDDLTDYHKAAAADGAWAIFPPIQHDHIHVESYMVNQRPGAPFVRVQPSGGSQAATDLGLKDTRRDIDLATENGPAADGDRNPITLDTPLADLRHGDGLRRHTIPVPDFTLVSHSLQRFSVMLSGGETVGDVLDAIETASGGEITARISDDGGRILLDDATVKRPLHLIGTDSNGSDVAARLIRATRVALSIGFVSTSIALLIGVTFGALMGYFGGWVDIVGMRIIEIFMAIPRLFLLLTIIAFIPPKWNEHMLYAMMAVIGATSWMGGARFIRAEFMRLRNQDFVQAAQACGLPLRSILFKHMLPNGVTPVLVDASFSVAAAILLETGLSFLGFGIKPPDPSWGQMLAGAVDTSTGVFYWWLAIFPGILIFLTVFSFNVVGDALRDAIDPKLKKAAH